MDDFERNQPRSFTGLKDEEWKRFTEVIQYWLGKGKRSFFLSTLVKKVNENACLQDSNKLEVDRKAQHAINDTFSFLGFKVLRRL